MNLDVSRYLFSQNTQSSKLYAINLHFFETCVELCVSGSSVTNAATSVSETVTKGRRAPQDQTQDSEREPLLQVPETRYTSINTTANAAPDSPPINVTVQTMEEVLAEERERKQRNRRAVAYQQRRPSMELATGNLVDIGDGPSVEDDNISTNTLDSTLNRSINSSLNNFARFSESDTSAYDAQSQSSQHSYTSKQT